MNPILCIANLLFVNPALADLIKDEIQNLITTPNLTILIKLVFTPQWVITQHHPSNLKALNVAQSMVKILGILPLDTLFNIYDKLVPIISNPQYLNSKFANASKTSILFLEFIKLDEKSFKAAHSKLEQLMVN
jgi:hypothetical protein